MIDITKLSNKQLNEVIETHGLDHSRGKEARAERQNRLERMWKDALEAEAEAAVNLDDLFDEVTVEVTTNTVNLDDLFV